MMNMRSTYPQLSIWSAEHVNNSQHRQDLFDKSIENNNRKQSYRLSMKTSQCCYSPMSACVQGVILALLSGGLILSIVITLWLTSSSKTTTTATSSTFTEVVIVNSTTIMGTSTTLTSSTVSTVASTIISTTLSTISTSTTILTSSSTTVTSSLSTSITSSISTTLTTTSCTTPTSTIAYYNGVTSYTLGTINYTALSTGTAVLEFGFTSVANNKIGYLDDVSILDTNAFNLEMLINGGFENGSLVGWQVLCTANCQLLSGSLSTTSCHTGSFCYTDGCKNALDFLRQTFSTTFGHVYQLSFWIQVNNNQDVYVSIF